MLNISVITPVFNAEKFLRKSVESALQFDEVKEILLIEDGSTDESLTVCNQLTKEYEKVKLLQHTNGLNKGAGATRNLGIENVTQEFIAFLDADDYYHPNRFEAEKKIFTNYPEADGVYGALGVFFQSDKVEKIFFQSFHQSSNNNNDFLTTIRSEVPPDRLFNKLVGLEKSEGNFHLDCLTIKTKQLKQLSYFFNESLRLHQDTEFIIRLSFHFNLYPGIIDKAIAVRGVHENNRITKVSKGSRIFYGNKQALFKSLYDWSKKNSLPIRTISFLRYKKNSLYLQSILPLEKVKLLLLKLTGKKNIPSLLYKTLIKK